MAIKWDKFVRRDRGSLLFGGILSLVTAFVLLFIHFYKENINSKDDITLISGQFNEYSWVDLGKRNGSSLTFTLKNYSNRFKIQADFLSILKKDKFKSISYGETLIIGIPNSYVKFLNTEKKPLLVYSIASNNLTYLDLKNTIEKHNSPLILLFSGLIGVGGLIFIYFGKRAKVKTPIW